MEIRVITTENVIVIDNEGSNKNFIDFYIEGEDGNAIEGTECSVELNELMSALIAFDAYNSRDNFTKDE